MNLSPRQLTVTVFGIGIAVSLAPFLLTLPHETTVWLEFAAIYLTTAIFLDGPRLLGIKQSVTLQHSIAVAVLATLISIPLRAWQVMDSRPELAITDLGFILLQFHVLLPFFAAFMAPLGVAQTGHRQVFILAVMLAPVVGATVSSLVSGWGFGPWFAILYHVLLFIVGGAIGLPLYLYGRKLRNGNSPSNHQKSSV